MLEIASPEPKTTYILTIFKVKAEETKNSTDKI